MIKGYLPGVFDLFHIGHLNIIRRAKKSCDYLIIGVTSDERCIERKGVKPFVPQSERLEIVTSIRYVDSAEILATGDKLDAWKRHHFQIIFGGSDWKGTAEWNDLEENLKLVGCKVMYFPYTRQTSSTKLREVLSMYHDKKTNHIFIPSQK